VLTHRYGHRVTEPPSSPPPGPTFRELHPLARVAVVVLVAALTVVVAALLALGGRWGLYWFLRAWHAAG
jgi:hypothetical protein